jgi:hypothetical protein
VIDGDRSGRKWFGLGKGGRREERAGKDIAEVAVDDMIDLPLYH